MRTVLSLLFCLWAMTSLGQEIKTSDAPPGITIRKYSWQQVGPSPTVDPSWKAESDSPSSTSEDSATTVERRGPAFLYSLEIQNDGAKPIKAIRWNYVIFDSKTNEELGTHEFENFDRVGRNKVKALNARSRVTPTRVVPIPITDKSATIERVVIKCIVYEDGTMWQSSGVTEPVCEALRRRAQN